MRLFMYPVMLALFLGTTVARADLYQFADPNGHIYYTDDPATVAKTEGVKTSSGQMAGDSSYDSGDAVSKEKGAAADELKLLEIRIAEEEQWLEKDRTAILKEKELLGNDRKRAQTPEQIRNYNQRIKNYNDRISDFLRRQSRLEDDRAEWKALRDTIAADGAKAEKAAPSGAEDVALDKRREALDAEYETLMSEKKKLEKAAKKAKTIEEKRQLNAQITDFNKKIKGYASKKDALNADIQEYNKQVTANLSDQVKEITAAENESEREQPSYDDEENRDEKKLQELKTRIDGEESYLADEYARLKEEKENLDRKRSNANTNEEIRDYNQSLEKLDARIAEYEKRNESFKSELADYNSRLKQVYENQLKKNAGDPPPADE